jgi:hypothetical protein
MANKTRTYKSSDWSIWTYKPEAGSFILDFSLLNGTAVLGTTGGGIGKDTGLISSFTLNEGSYVESSILPTYQPTTLSVEIRKENFVIGDMLPYQVGSEIVLALKNEETVPGSVYGYNTPFFFGRIRQVNVSVESESKFATLSIQASRKFQDDLNVLITVPKTTGANKTGDINAAAAAKGCFEFSPQVTNNFTWASNVTETKTYGEFIEDFNICEMLIPRDFSIPQSYVDGGGVRTWTFFPYLSFVDSKNINTPDLTLTDSSIANFVLDWSGFDSPSAVTLTNYTNPATVFQSGVNAQNSAGSFAYNATVDVQNIAQMTTIGQTALSMTRSFRPVRVTQEYARTYQNITFTDSSSTWMLPANLIRVGQELRVNSSRYGTDTTSKVVGRTIEVTPDNWLVTYDLWKGFDTPPAPTNLIANGSATTTNLTGWGDTIRTTSEFNTTPASWMSFYSLSSEEYEVNYYQPVLTVGARYSLSFWAKNVSPNTISVQFDTGVNFSVTNITPSTSVWTYYKVENQLCTTNTNLSLIFKTPGNDFYIDDVAVVLGPTAL